MRSRVSVSLQPNLSRQRAFRKHAAPSTARALTGASTQTVAHRPYGAILAQASVELARGGWRGMICSLRGGLVAACALAGMLPLLLILGPVAGAQPGLAPSVVFGALLIGGGVGAAVGLLVSRRIVRSLAELTQEVQRLSRADRLDPRPQQSHEPIELTQLAEAIWLMRDRLAAAPPVVTASATPTGPAPITPTPPPSTPPPSTPPPTPSLPATSARPSGPPVADRHLEIAARSANDGLWDWDLSTDTLYCSPRWHAIVGVEDGDDLAPSSFWLERVHPEDVQTLRSALDAHVRGEAEHFVCEARVRGDDGAFRWTLCRGSALRRDDGTAYRIAGSLTDVTERRTAEARRIHEARHDALTGLANRAHFLERLTYSLATRDAAPGHEVAVLLLDIDRFKVINDSLGHAIGDEMLVAAARRAEVCVSEAVIVGRLSGDELVVLLDSDPTAAEALQAAERIRRAFREPLRVGSHSLFVTVSIGVALGSSPEQAPDALLRDAETAMYHAKELGRDRVVLFEQALHDRAQARLDLDSDLRLAIERDELLLHFQPIVGISGAGACGVEALVRWRHPVRGLVPPVEFIPFAEESGLIVPLGAWVLKQAIAQMRAWQAAGVAPERIAVNISARQLHSDELADLVAGLLRDAELDPACLELELTEGVVAEQAETTIDVVRRLRQLGVQLSVDDFGTGYSSLAYLARFPVTTLKVDRAFLIGIEDDTVNQAIVSAVTTLAHRIGVRVVAEGIETARQLEVARSLGCDEAQGFLISRPLPVDEATIWLAGQRRRPQLLRPVTRVPDAS